MDITPDLDFMIIACDGIWDCFTNEQAVKFVKTKQAKGPKPVKQKSRTNGRTGLSNSPLKMSKTKSDSLKKTPKPKGETSFIIEEMMD